MADKDWSGAGSAQLVAPLTKAEVEQQLAQEIAERDMPHMIARALLYQKILDDLDFWYQQAKEIAKAGGRNALPRVQMILGMLDKVAPDKKEFTRGLVGTAGAKTVLNLGHGKLQRGTEASVRAAVDHRGRVAVSLQQRSTERDDPPADD